MPAADPVGARAVATTSLAHELNNVLTVIAGNLALAERHAAGNAKLLRLLTNMRTAAERGTSLAQTLMGAPQDPSPGFGGFGFAEEIATFGENLGGPAGLSAAGKHSRILVVEDEPLVAKIAMTVLEDLGHEVALAPDGPTAVSMLGAQRFDLVLSDIVMPGGMSGIELAEHIAANHPDLPILLATGFSNAALAPGALRFPVLAKPYSIQELSRRVTQMLPASASANPGTA